MSLDFANLAEFNSGLKLATHVGHILRRGCGTRNAQVAPVVRNLRLCRLELIAPAEGRLVVARRSAIAFDNTSSVANPAADPIVLAHGPQRS